MVRAALLRVGVGPSAPVEINFAGLITFARGKRIDGPRMR
jgi:hypothetical protein